MVNRVSVTLLCVTLKGFSMSDNDVAEKKEMTGSDRLIFWIMLVAICLFLLPELYQILNPKPAEQGYSKMVVLKGDSSNEDIEDISYCTFDMQGKTSTDDIVKMAIDKTKIDYPEFTVEAINIGYCPHPEIRDRL